MYTVHEGQRDKMVSVIDPRGHHILAFWTKKEAQQVADRLNS